MQKIRSEMTEKPRPVEIVIHESFAKNLRRKLTLFRLLTINDGRPAVVSARRA